MTILEKIAEIEAEMARTQKNKATNAHLGRLKGKLAKLRTELIEGTKGGGGGKGEGFDVLKSGSARVAMIGFPSVGKSTLLSKVTETKSEVGAYEFTTLTCIPGVITHHGAKIQLLDLPGIIEGAAKGRGRGRQVIGVARTADLVLMVLDACEGDKTRPLLEAELESVGIRLNQDPPNIYFKRKKGGGVKFSSTVQLTMIDEETVLAVLQEYKIHNCEISIREDVNVDQLVDVIEGNRKYIRCLYAYNKVDTVWLEEVDRLARLPDSLVISCHWDLNLDLLKDLIWEYLDLTRVYTKRRGCMPDFEEPVILRNGCSVEDLCATLHKSLAVEFKHAFVWGRSAKHTPQLVGLKHMLEDEDVVEIVKKQLKNALDSLQNSYVGGHTTAKRGGKKDEKGKKAPLKT